MTMSGPIIHCRMCLWPVEQVLQLAATPIANDFKPEPSLYAMKFPLSLTRCTNAECNHVQIGYNINGEQLYSDYKYLTPEAERGRLAALAAQYVKKYPNALREKATSNSKTQEMPKVLEIGSNSGIFVEELNKAGFWACGIDPSPLAPKTGMPKWFNTKTARQIAYSMGKMKLIVANNVFAHVDDIRNVMLGVKYALADEGHLVFEVQYLPDLIRGGMFDMIYHEHKDYHTLKPWVRLLKKFGMCIQEVEHIDTHGGSIRVHVGYGEKGIDVSDPEVDWGEVNAKIDAGRERVLQALNGYEKVAAFGATAKATTLIHNYGLADRISYMIDETPSKIGNFMPGTTIPIHGFEHLEKDKPEAVLITAWNYADVIRPRLGGIKTVVPF